jgi:hypothetical protein
MALAYGVALLPYLHCKLMVCVVRHYPRLCLVAGGAPSLPSGVVPPFSLSLLCALKAFITKPYAA